MKKLLIIAIFLVTSFYVYTQEKTADLDKYKNLKKISSKETEEVKADIKKPDNSAIMPRTPTDKELNNKINIKDRIKKSNKLLY